MDEMQMIAEMLDERPAEAAADTGRRRLRKEIAAPARRTPSWFGLRFKAGLGVVAAGTAAAVAITAVGSGAPAPPGSPSQVELADRAVLAAADKAAAQPIGKYWSSGWISGQSYIVRAETGDYAIVGAQTEFFRWSGAKSGMGEAFYGRELPARLHTARDKELWKKAGSPPEFRVWSNDHYYTYGRKATEWEVDDPDPAGGGNWLGGRTVEDFQRLPTDPEKLAAMFFVPRGSRKIMDPRKLRQAEERVGEHSGRLRTPPPMTAFHKLFLVENMLQDAPVPPAVRAGLMRALAAQPGVRSVGERTDPLGREGVALAADRETSRITGEWGAPEAERGEYDSRAELIFDRETGEMLAAQNVLTRPGGPYRDREPGFVIDYSVVRDSGWTDTRPKPAEKLPSWPL
ncbi:hypothetical protein [Spirillospora sp. NPDC048824]|uniref:hypothetical protein n=1 Tax=Spirillospora sp. NPDC048824 TaxID=3364526 RepID=UPI00371DC398